MHELGVVFKVIDNLKEVAAENGIEKIDKVKIGLGEVSTVIPEYLQDCFKWAKRKSPLVEDCDLEIETIPAVSYCEDCGNEYPTVEFAKICPSCHSEHTYLLRGNEFVIKEIEVR